jgi:ABC-2 type transport system permease protein
MYVVIFIAMTIAFTQNATSSQEQIFNTQKFRVSIIDNDKSTLSEELSKYIKENSKYIELTDTSEEGLKDTLFFRNSEYIIIIPENFGDKYFTDQKLMLQTMKIPNSTSGMFLEMMINKYLNTAELYDKADIALGESLKKLAEDLSVETNVKFANGENISSMPSFSYYFNYLVYPLVSILVLIISGTTLAINEIDVKRRNIGSPVSTSKFSFGLFLANSSIAIAIYAVFLGLAAIMYKDSLFTQAGMLTVLNGFIFTILSLSLCFLISNIVNNKTVSAISTVLSLLMCFTGGVFVPQQYLSESVKNVAVINPAFWYVKANNTLGNLSTINLDNLKPVLSAFLVQICFAIAFLSISLVLIKQKRTSEV